MNFFEHQDEARRSTRWLILFFILAVIALIAMANLLIIIFYAVLASEQEYVAANVPMQVHLWVAGGMAAIIILATAYKMNAIRGGGSKVAEALGGRLISSSTTNPDERKVLNVVEEMAIASGAPVPPVYLLDDSAINAFAAGFTVHDAVIGVTRGAIELLNRAEIQGVIAHEFSHILNGDMRLNLRLIGVLFGILFIALVGQKIIRSTLYSRSKDNTKFVLLGAALVVIGYSGMFFGSLIKAAISRQREYLADASAVQFTRNPDSIGGALKKIGGWAVGSRLAIDNASEYSHFYIAEGVSAFSLGFFNTHPPLSERIKRIQPTWDGSFPKVRRSADAVYKAAQEQRKHQAKSQQQPLEPISIAVIASLVASAGSPTSDHVKYARSLVEQIPQQLINATRKPVTAYALVLGLMLLKDYENWSKRIQTISPDLRDEVMQQLLQYMPIIKSLDIKHRLPLIELSMPSLKELQEAQRKLLKSDLLRIIKSDSRVELWEWALFRIIKLGLSAPEFSREKYGNYSQLKQECCLVLAAVVYSGTSDSAMAEAAFSASASELKLDMKLPKIEQLNGSGLSAALKNLRKLKSLAKPKLLKALYLAAQHDGKIEAEEVELVRAIAESIDCPMPPMLSA